MLHRNELSPLTLLTPSLFPTTAILWIFYIVLDNTINHLSIKKTKGFVEPGPRKGPGPEA